MPFVDTNSQLTTKPYNFDIKCHEAMIKHIFFGTRIFLFMLGGFYNEIVCSSAHWLGPLLDIFRSFAAHNHTPVIVGIHVYF